MTDQEDFHSIHPERVRKVKLHEKTKGTVEAYQTGCITDSFNCLKQQECAATYLEFLKDSPLIQKQGSTGPSEVY